jgi:hypothetical protein
MFKIKVYFWFFSSLLLLCGTTYCDTLEGILLLLVLNIIVLMVEGPSEFHAVILRHFCWGVGYPGCFTSYEEDTILMMLQLLMQK